MRPSTQFFPIFSIMFLLTPSINGQKWMTCFDPNERFLENFYQLQNWISTFDIDKHTSIITWQTVEQPVDSGYCCCISLIMNLISEPMRAIINVQSKYPTLPPAKWMSAPTSTQASILTTLAPATVTTSSSSSPDTTNNSLVNRTTFTEPTLLTAKASLASINSPIHKTPISLAASIQTRPMDLNPTLALTNPTSANRIPLTANRTVSTASAVLLGRRMEHSTAMIVDMVPLPPTGSVLIHWHFPWSSSTFLPSFKVPLCYFFFLSIQHLPPKPIP